MLLFSSSVMSDSAALWTAAKQPSLSFTISWSLLKLMSVESVIPSNHLMLCRPLLLLFSIFPSIRVYSNELAPCVRWPVQGTLKSVLQHHSSKASIFRRSAFFTVQLSHPYMTTGKTTALTRQSTGEGNGKSLQYSCLENTMNSRKRQNDRIPKEELFA